MPAPGFLGEGFRRLAFAPVLAALGDRARGRARLEALQVRAGWAAVELHSVNKTLLDTT